MASRCPSVLSVALPSWLYLVVVWMGYCLVQHLRLSQRFRTLNPLNMRVAGYEESNTALGLLFVATALAVFRYRRRNQEDLLLHDALQVVLAAVGLYLLPYLLCHKRLLAFTCLVLIACAMRCRRRGGKGAQVWSLAICLLTCSCLAAPLGCVVPLASAKPSLSEIESDTEQDVAPEVRRLMEQNNLDGMTYGQIASFAQAVAHVEATRLGIADHEPLVIIGYCGSSYAYFDPDLNRLCLDPVKLRNLGSGAGATLISYVAHEMAHAYQHAVIEGWTPYVGTSPLGEITPSVLARWKEEMMHPIDPDRNGGGYLGQDIERHARAYAQDAPDRYLAAAGL